MTLNDLERRNDPYILRYFTKFGSFRAYCVKVVKDVVVKKVHVRYLIP